MSRTTIGKYEDLQLIGQGGMAEVYIGTDPTLHRKVAIKLILPHFADKSDFEARFQREAKTIANLRHANIVQIYEYSIEDGNPFMVMEYLDGGTLSEILAKYKEAGRPMPLEEAANILDKIASGLDYAHKRGLIHRDIKPANILFSEDGEPIVADFGIVKLLDEGAALTQTGGVVGSPRYLSPEQASQNEVDKRSDIYSLGIVLYQMVTGEVPFEGDLVSVMMQHVNDPPESPITINADLPHSIANVVLKALEKDPDNRFNSVGEMAKAFRGSLDGTFEDIVASTIESVPPSETIISKPKDKPVPKSSSGKMIGIIIGIVLLAVVGYIAFNGGLGVAEEDTPVPTEVVAASGDKVVPTEAVLEDATKPALTEEPTRVPVDTTTPRGEIIFRDSTLVATFFAGLGSPAEGNAFHAWLTEPSTDPLYLGTIDPDGDEFTYHHPENHDLFLSYSGFVIKEESASGPPDFSGTDVFQAQVDEQLVLDYRHLKNTSGGTINQAMNEKIIKQANSFTDHTDFCLNDILSNNSLNGAKNHAEHTINIASGVGSPDYFDWDNDGRPENPGDDVGLLPYVRLLANVVTVTNPELADQVDQLISQIEAHVSLMTKISASDTVDEMKSHAESLDAERGQIVEQINSFISGLVDTQIGVRFEVFATGN